MKKRAILTTFLAALALLPLQAGANLVINGDFEMNSATGTEFNPSNATLNGLLPNFTAYGIREGIDLQTFGSGFGAAPQSGDWKVSPAADAGGNAEEFSLDLSGTVVAGQTYELTFYIERLVSGLFDGGAVDIGLSSSATAFGIGIFTSALAVDGWTLQSTSFVAPVNADFLTVRVLTTDDSWVGLDNFSLRLVPIPPALLLFGPALLLLLRPRRS